MNVEFLTKDEHDKIAADARESAVNVLRDLPLHDDVRNALGAEIGNNVAQAVLASISMLLPLPSEVLWQNARSSVWANEADGAGRAGLFSAQLSALQRTLVEGSADAALAALEERLFALFSSVRKLRQLPPECRFAHMTIEDAHGLICTRCGERPEL